MKLVYFFGMLKKCSHIAQSLLGVLLVPVLGNSFLECSPRLTFSANKHLSNLGSNATISHSVQFSSVQFSRSVVSDSLRPHELQHTRPPWESAALNLPANLENSAMATGLEKVSFHSNPKETQCQRMLKLPHNCTHLTC